MYFLDLRGAKAQLVAGPVPTDRVLPYLIAISAMLTLIFETTRFFPLVSMADGELPVLEWVDVALALLVGIVGTLYVYRCNGGPTGEALLERWLLLSWVVGLRVLLLMWLLLIGVSLVVPAETDAGSDLAAPLTWIELFAAFACQVLLYWRVGVHIRDVSLLRSRQTNPLTPAGRPAPPP